MLNGLERIGTISGKRLRSRFKNDRITVDTESSDKQYLYLDTKLSKHNVNIR